MYKSKYDDKDEKRKCGGESVTNLKIFFHARMKPKNDRVHWKHLT